MSNSIKVTGNSGAAKSSPSETAPDESRKKSSFSIPSSFRGLKAAFGGLKKKYFSTDSTNANQSVSNDGMKVTTNDKKPVTRDESNSGEGAYLSKATLANLEIDMWRKGVIADANQNVPDADMKASAINNKQDIHDSILDVNPSFDRRLGWRRTEVAVSPNQSVSNVGMKATVSDDKQGARDSILVVNPYLAQRLLKRHKR